MKRIILLHGLPGAGKTTLADLLAFKLGAARVNADYVRANINRDLGFSREDRIEHARRMAEIANVTLSGSADFTVVDFVCPTKDTREAFTQAAKHPVIWVWMNTIAEGRFPDTNKMYETPGIEYQTRVVEGYLTAGAFALKAEQLALAFASQEGRSTYFIRYNTMVGDGNLRWRVIEASTMKETLVEDFRVEGQPMFAASSFEYGCTKWNVGVNAVAVFANNKVTFK